MDKKEAILYRRTYGEKAYRELMKSQRVSDGMNLGTRTHKSAKDYDRRSARRDITDSLNSIERY